MISNGIVVVWKGYTAQKIKFSIMDFFNKWQNPQEAAD